MKMNLFFILLTLAFTSVCYAQQKSVEPTIIKADGNSCELSSLYIDGLRNELANGDERVFVIIRKTNNETNYVRYQRLLQIRGILLGYKGFPKEKVIFAEGEDDESQGRVEFYLGSRLFFTALARKNLLICWDCCDVSYNDYVKVPRKKILKKKHK